jgi:hypothetical protein
VADSRPSVLDQPAAEQLLTDMLPLPGPVEKKLIKSCKEQGYARYVCMFSVVCRVPDTVD